ncbi:hypothetical protein [Arsenophonus endosymbiont of Bemisia tabaci]|uniref:hypothetical protein n=1 Tax=Arsenophonus endosymbiont of Bemisia tabaci TaxID=536059 RepID=UPI0015F3DF20|nr:hypothetical protein [Arsenophonus endosymbiont of Bemisia tabaci]CAA2930310.1 hypothetical protein ARSQ2_01435 [Arsenophonus endosymbiont of Bemisia tabaci Q2]CAA2930481.1 hypothetical protein ARSQ2_01612 [Arsenophonus endosymbiont of Bemisia tabaci Q2]
MRHRYFVRTEYGVIKIKSISYSSFANCQSFFRVSCNALPAAAIFFPDFSIDQVNDFSQITAV